MTFHLRHDRVYSVTYLIRLDMKMLKRSNLDNSREVFPKYLLARNTTMYHRIESNSGHEDASHLSHGRGYVVLYSFVTDICPFSG